MKDSDYAINSKPSTDIPTSHPAARKPITGEAPKGESPRSKFIKEHLNPVAEALGEPTREEEVTKAMDEAAISGLEKGMSLVAAFPSTIPDTGTRSQFDTGAVRDGMEGKGMPSLIPSFPLYLLSVRLEEGAKKYGRDNWRKGIPLSRYLDGFDRHLRKWKAGWEDEDHEGAMMFNITALIDTAQRIRTGELPRELDDIPEQPIARRLQSYPNNWALQDLYREADRDPYVQTEFDLERRKEAERAASFPRKDDAFGPQGSRDADPPMK